MVYWNRFISYIFRYHNYDKCENTGFAKVQKQNEKGKMQVNLKDQVKKEGLYSVYLYRETLADPEEYPEAVPDSMVPVVLYLGKLSLKSGRGEGSFTFDWNNVNHTGRPITAWSGIIIRRMGEEESDIFCSSWTDNTVDYSQAFARREAAEADRERKADVAATESEYDCRKILSEPGMKPKQNVRTDNVVQMTADFRKADHSQEQSYKDMGVSEMDTASENMNSESASEAMTSKTEETAHTDTDSPETVLPEMEESPDEETFSQTDEETEKRVTAAEVLETMKEDGRAAELMANREKLPLLPNCPDGENGVIECVKINPNDIGLLNMDNWRLGVNSFLTHGFYSYKYLMLGRVLFDEEDTNGYILGVPGEYSSKEKYLAGIFGFDRFIPVKETRIKTGSFGYWVVDLK